MKSETKQSEKSIIGFLVGSSIICGLLIGGFGFALHGILGGSGGLLLGAVSGPILGLITAEWLCALAQLFWALARLLWVFPALLFNLLRRKPKS